MTILYTIGLAHDDQTGNYVAFVESVADRKRTRITATKFAPLLSTLTKRLRKKERMSRNFPLPSEPKLILIPPKPNGARIIIP